MLGRVDLERSDDDLIAKLTDEWQRYAKPIKRIANPTLPDEPWGVYRRNDDTTSVSHWRWLVRFPLEGNLALLGYWPSELSVNPCDSNLHKEPHGMAWQFSSHGAGVVVFLDVPRSEDPAGEQPPQDWAVEAADYLNDVISVVNAELASFQEGFMRDLRLAIGSRRAKLGRIAEQSSTVIELIARKYPPLQFEEAHEPRMQAGQSRLNEMSLPSTLKRSSFDDLLRVCQEWIISAQRYPGDFSKLNEEAVTSVLVTTLNVAFDAANREVFIGMGKSDIFVETHRDGQSQKIFIGEAKVWGGPSEVVGNLNQLFGYIPSHVGQATLLYYVHTLRLAHVIKAVADKISGYAEVFQSWKEVGKVAVLQHPEFGHKVEVAVMYAHFPVHSRKK